MKALRDESSDLNSVGDTGTYFIYCSLGDMSADKEQNRCCYTIIEIRILRVQYVLSANSSEGKKSLRNEVLRC